MMKRMLPLFLVPLLALSACRKPPMNPPSLRLEPVLKMPVSAVSAKAFISGNRILDLDGKVLAGGKTGRSRGNIPAVGAPLDGPDGLAVDPKNHVFFSDTGNHRIYRIEGGKLVSVAGTGTNFYPIGDGGPATSAQLNHPAGIAFDSQGLLYFSDSDNHRIRRIDAQGKIETFAGKGTMGHGGDGGAAKDATLNHPTGLAFDTQGNLYIADTGNHKIRRVDPKGTIQTVAGNGEAGFKGDGGSGKDASLNGPTSVLPRGKELFIADTGNGRIRWVDAFGRILTVAGKGPGTAKAGPAIDSPLASPVIGGDLLVGASTGLYRLRPVVNPSKTPS